MRNKEVYSKDYLESAKSLEILIEIPSQQIVKTAEAAFAVDSYPVGLEDEPERSPTRGRWLCENHSL